MADFNSNKRNKSPSEGSQSTKRMRTNNAEGNSSSHASSSNPPPQERRQRDVIDLTEGNSDMDDASHAGRVFRSLVIPPVRVPAPATLEAMREQLTDFQRAYIERLDRIARLLRGQDQDLVEQHHHMDALAQKNKDLEAKFLTLAKAHNNLRGSVDAAEKERKKEQIDLRNQLKNETAKMMKEMADIKAKLVRSDTEDHEMAIGDGSSRDAPSKE